jgi:hypothetical protein
VNQIRWRSSVAFEKFEKLRLRAKLSARDAIVFECLVPGAGHSPADPHVKGAI